MASEQPIKRAYRHVLAALERAGGALPVSHLPNGHGHTIPRGASRQTLHDMEMDGLIQWRVTDGRATYVITPKGRLTLEEATSNG